MTNAEFSDMFSTLLNSYNSQAQFGEQASKAEIVLDEYEKSVLLTQAQDLIVKSYFDRTLNNQGQGFDDSTRRQVDFSSLIKVADATGPISSTTTTVSSGYPKSGSTAWNGGTLSYTNKTSANLNFVLKLTTEATSNYGVKCTYANNTLTVSLHPSESEGDELWANMGAMLTAINDSIANTVGSASTKVSDLITLTFSNNAADIPADGNATIVNVTLGTSEEHIVSTGSFDSRGLIYKLPTKTVNQTEVSDVLFILNEKMVDTSGKEYVVIPISYAEYDREMSKPYAQPLKKQAWRLFHNVSTGFDMYSELIPKFNITAVTYKLRYVRRPQPIVLEQLPNDLTVDGVNEETPCELNPILHIDILNKAVELAITTRGGSAPSSYDRTAQRSESR